MSGRAAGARSLREACVEEGLAIIGAGGIESLSLRDLARRLGVSHQAPYKHFPSRDHLLAEIVRRAFDDFAEALAAGERVGDAYEASRAMGVGYVGFALSRPLHYRLMFGGALPDADQHPEMMRSARRAFSLLRESLRRVFAASGTPISEADLDLESLVAWSSLHGVVSLLRTDAIGTLELDPRTIDGLVARALERVGSALGVAPPPIALPFARRES